MKNFKFKKSISAVLAIIFVIASMFVMSACGNEKATDGNAYDATVLSGGVIGEGENQFVFTVVDTEGKETEFEVHTDKTIVGEALLDLGIINGDQGDYGLYVKTVNGITLDYETDGKYWAFYVDGEYAMTGVDMTEITTGATYTFKAE